MVETKKGLFMESKKDFERSQEKIFVPPTKIPFTQPEEGEYTLRCCCEGMKKAYEKGLLSLVKIPHRYWELPTSATSINIGKNRVFFCPFCGKKINVDSWHYERRIYK
jgi:hypothetical protein